MDIKLTEKYLETLDETSDEFTFIAIHDSNKSMPVSERHGKFEVLKKELEELNNSGYGIFVTINKTNLKRRTKQAILEYRALWAEKDSGEFGELPIEPTMVVNSKRGKHLYWILKDFIPKENYSKYESLLKRIAIQLESDVNVCDMSRVLRLPGFNHMKQSDDPFMVNIAEISHTYYTIEQIETAFPFRKPGRPTIAENYKGGRGVLLASVKKFLNEPWSESTNSDLIAATANIKRNGFSEEECRQMIEGKGESLDRNTSNQIAAIYRNNESYIVKPFVPDKNIESVDDGHSEFILGSTCVVDPLIKDTIFVVDENNLRIKEYRNSVVRGVLGKEYNPQICDVEYSPDKSELFYMKDGLKALNMYVIPKWKKKILTGEVTKAPPMPLQHQIFFNHLAGEYPQSLNYILDWIAFGLQGKRNITILALAGTAREIGKSSLAHILRTMHGEQNSRQYGPSLLKEKFNAGMDKCTFAHLEEVTIDDEKAFESIKIYTSSIIRVEGKGTNATDRPFYANILLTNNLPESLSGIVSEDDRQFSIPELTKNKLSIDLFKEFGAKNVSFLWQDETAVEQLAQHLYFRDLSEYDETTPLKSPQYHRVIRVSMSEWFRFLTTDFRALHLNCAVPYLPLRTVLCKNSYGAISSSKIEEKFRKYPAMAAIKIIEGRTYLVYSKEKESTKFFQTRLDLIDSKENHGFEILKLPKCLID